MLMHFTIKPFDSSLDYEHICKSLFGDNRCLVIVEKKGGEHAHVQGVLEQELSDWDWRQVCKNISNQHYKRKSNPNCAPVKKRRVEADDSGFQYMCKELPTSTVIYKQGFSDEDLQELYEQSNEYREELQCKLGEYIVEKIGPNTTGWTPSELHKRVCYYAFQYYLAEGKMRPPNIKLLCEHYMAKYWGNRLDVAEYISGRWI